MSNHANPNLRADLLQVFEEMKHTFIDAVVDRVERRALPLVVVGGTQAAIADQPGVTLSQGLGRRRRRRLPAGDALPRSMRNFLAPLWTSRFYRMTNLTGLVVRMLAVRSYQRAHGLAATGVANRYVWRRLLAGRL